MDKQLQALQHNLEAAGHAASDHFRGVTKMVESGNYGRRHHDGR
jgi:hypothetical protein